MSRSAQFFLLVLAPALSLVLALLGVETLSDNVMGWPLLILGIAYPATAISAYCIRKVPFWQAAGRVLHEEQGDRSFWGILPGMIGAFFASPLEYMYMGALLPRSMTLQIAGLALLAVGTALGAWARYALRGSHSGHVQVTAEQALVIRGPYCLMRHPSYAGFLLVAAGVAVGYSSLLGLAATGLLLLPALAHRIRVEETLLEHRFGDPYRLYRRRVRSLIPGIW